MTIISMIKENHKYLYIRKCNKKYGFLLPGLTKGKSGKLDRKWKSKFLPIF